MGSFVILLLTLVLQAPPGESNPEQARQQVERLMNAGLPFAEKMLAEHGEFEPFGAVMLQKGLIQAVGTEEVPESVPTEQILAGLIEGLELGAEQGEYRAVATFAMVELRDPGRDRIVSAVHVALEHQDGLCIDVYYPTVLEGDSIVLGQSFAGRRHGVIFTRCNETPTSEPG